MNNLTKSLIVIVMLFINGTVFAAAELGKDYTLLQSAQPTDGKKIEVLEFFFYECPHCFHLHPLLSAWEKTMPKDVQITFVPTIFHKSTEPTARTFYALESMGQIDKLDDAIYQAIHVDKIGLYDLNSIGDFVAKHGVDREKFSDVYNSFSINSKVLRAEQMIRIYGISGTPTLVVDGKYAIQSTQENQLQPADLIRVLKDVIVIARKEHASKH